MGNIINVVNILGWSALLYLVLKKLVLNPYNFNEEDLTLEVGLVGVVQTFQILDIVLILLGKSKGSLISSIAQISGRLVVALIFMEVQTKNTCLLLVFICWGIADITRYSYYLIKSDILTLLRYNLFLILYPVGVYGQMTVINNYIKRHAATLEVYEISYIRWVQAAIIIGMIFLYIYMIKMRSKQMRKLGGQGKIRNL